MVNKSLKIAKLVLFTIVFSLCFSFVVYSSTSTIINLIVQNPLISKGVGSSLRDLAGYNGERLYLVFIADSTETRVLGGFSGWVALVRVVRGDMTFPEVTPGEKALIRIYDLERMLPKNRMIPMPAPTNQKWWSLGGSLLWPDLPSCAGWAKKFFDLEVNSGIPFQTVPNVIPWPNSLKKIDGIVVINSEFGKEFIKQSGSIRVNKKIINDDSDYSVNEEFNYKNFDVLINYYSNGFMNGSGYPASSEIFNEILRIGLERLNTTSSIKQYAFLNFFIRMLNSKNIMICSFNPRVESAVKFLGWGGELRKYTNDFLGVFDDASGSYMTRMYTSRRIDYQFSVDNKGQPRGKTKVVYFNKGKVPIKDSRFNWFNNRPYKAYVRIYVPNGSKYVRSIFRSKLFVDYYPLDRKPSSQNKGPHLGLQLGRTYFGGWFNLSPGRSKSFWYEYRLPSSVIKKVGNKKIYRLYYQKQAGTRTEDVWFTFVKPKNCRILKTSKKPYRATRSALVFKFSTQFDLNNLSIEFK